MMRARRGRLCVVACLALCAAPGCYDFSVHPFAAPCDEGRCEEGYTCDLARGGVCLPADVVDDEDAGEDADAG